MSSLIVAVLCPDEGRLYGARIINALSEAEIPIRLLITTPPGSGLWERSLLTLRREGLAGILDGAVRFIRNRREASRSLKFVKKDFEVVEVPDLNHPACAEALKRNGVSVAILASAPIIRPHIIDALSWGALNAHAGLLPRYRGTGCVAWAIAHDDPIGASVHKVTPHLDAGPVCLTKELTVEANDTLESLWQKNFELRVEMLRDALKNLMTGELRFVEQKPEEGKIFRGRDMTSEISAAIGAKLPIYIKERLGLYAKGDYPWITYDPERPEVPSLLVGPPGSLRL